MRFRNSKRLKMMIFKPKRLIVQTKKGCTLSKKTRVQPRGGTTSNPLKINKLPSKVVRLYPFLLIIIYI